MRHANCRAANRPDRKLTTIVCLHRMNKSNTQTIYPLPLLARIEIHHYEFRGPIDSIPVTLLTIKSI